MCMFLKFMNLELVYMPLSHIARNLSLGYPARSDTNQAAQPQQMPRGLTFSDLERIGDCTI